MKKKTKVMLKNTPSHRKLDKVLCLQIRRKVRENCLQSRVIRGIAVQKVAILDNKGLSRKKHQVSALIEYNSLLETQQTIAKTLMESR